MKLISVMILLLIALADYSESFHCHSAAPQRAEAFLRCKGLWKDETQPLSVGKEPSVG